MESMYFDFNEHIPLQEEWIRLGKPKMYKKFYSDGFVVAWDNLEG